MGTMAASLDGSSIFRIAVWRKVPMRLLCAMALVVSYYVPAAAIGPNDPASLYYKNCVASGRKAHVPDERCDGLIINGLTGIIIGQFNQGHSAFCFPQRLEDQMQAIDNDRRGHSGRPSEKSLSAIASFEAEMRAAVARYMRDHPERLSQKTLQVIIEALLYAFPCPG
jgi:hypothetical protein